MTFLRQLPMDQYHQHESLSSTKIKLFRKRGPRAFYERFVAKTLVEDDDTDSKAFGRAFDDLFFNGPCWELAYAIKPKGMKLNTSEGKAWAAAIGKREVVTWEESQLMESMRAAIMRNSLARQLFSEGEAQVSIRRQLPSYQLQVQCRPDWLCLQPVNGTPYIADLKTVDRMERFELDAVTYGYHSQMALAQWIIAQEGPVCAAYLPVVEKQMAGRCQVFQIPEDVLQDAWAILKKDIEDIAGRMRSGIWHEDQTEPTIARIPGWQRQQLVEDANA